MSTHEPTPHGRITTRRGTALAGATLLAITAFAGLGGRTASATVAEPDAALSLVGLGDSNPGAGGCEAPCRGYVEVLGGLAAATLGQPVTVSNLATNDSVTSDMLLARVRTDAAHIAALSNADIVTIQVGFNDWQGPCFWPNHEECFAAGSEQVHGNLELILDEIDKLREGAPTAVRVVTYFDTTIGQPGTSDSWGFAPEEDAAFHAFYSSALADFNAMLCEVAETHDALCVELVEAFNGPSGDEDAAALLGDDHGHLNKAGHELVATTIDAMGYAPLDATASS